MHDMPGSNSIDPAWRLDFESLTLDCATLLGTMCYLMPDSIPQALFEPTEVQDLPSALDFCADELAFSDVIDELLETAIIQRDMPARILSLNRLVPKQFRGFSSPEDNQKYFDITACLLFQTFPQSDAEKGQLYDRWTECQRHLQHVLSLKNQYKDSLASKQPLIPGWTFTMLLKSLARFLLESASYKEVEDSLGVVISTFKKLKEQDAELYSDLCASSGLAWAHRGLLALARPWLEQSHQIRAEADPPNGFELSWTEINMGNLEASSNNYSVSLEWQIKALRNRQMTAGDDSSAMHPQAMLYQNLGRSKYLAGNFSEAHIWCHIAAGLLSESQNWAMLAYTYFVLGNLSRAERDLARSQQEYSRAQQVWLEKGQMHTHHFNGACMYKLGCVAFDRGDTESAIKHLQESLVIAKLHQEVLTGDYARVLHKLAVVLGSQAEHEPEAETKREEAKAIARARLGLGEGAVMANDEQTYDNLVYILWR